MLIILAAIFTIRFLSRIKETFFTYIMKPMHSILSASVNRQSGPGISKKTIIEDAKGGSMLDLNTDLQTGFAAFHLADVYIIDGSDNRITNGNIGAKTKFSIVYEGLGNFSLKDGKVYPKLSIILRGGHDNIMIEENDLLSEYTDGFSPQDVSVLRATVDVSEPITHGEYFLSITVTDQNNKDANIITTWSFHVN
jgi:hypothetical protein